MGTTDSPLVFAALLCVAGGLSLSLRRSVVRVPLLVLFLVGTLIAQARAGTAVLCLILVYAVLRPTMALWARALTTVVLGGVAYLVLTSDWSPGSPGGSATTRGSVAARLRALRFIADTAGSYLGTGRGLTASYDVARNAGLQTSLESSFLMYVVDVGLILATLYFGLQVVLVLRYGRHGYLPGATVAALGGDRSAARFQRCGRGQPDRNADLGRAGHRRGRILRPDEPTARSARSAVAAVAPAGRGLSSSANARASAVDIGRLVEVGEQAVVAALRRRSPATSVCVLGARDVREVPRHGDSCRTGMPERRATQCSQMSSARGARCHELGPPALQRAQHGRRIPDP